MEYIKHFNRSVNKQFELNPSNETLLLIKKYKNKGKYPDYYQTLDSIGFKVGVEFLVQPILDEDKTVGYIPTLKLNRNKLIGEKFEQIEFSELKSINKAYAYIAKQQIYKLMDIRNLQEILMI